MEKEESIFEHIGLLILAENGRMCNQFVEDLQSFLQNGKRGADVISEKCNGYTSFNVKARQFHIISGPILSESDTLNDIPQKSYMLQEYFIRPLNLKAIIFLMQPDPRSYRRFLSQILFNNFTKDDISEMVKNIMFVFVHNIQVSYKKICVVDEDLWTVLMSIQGDLIHSKTFHYYSRLNKDLCNMFVQFIYKNKNTVNLETVYSHKSVLKLVTNKGFLDLLMEALFLNEDNIHNKTTDKTEQYYLLKWNDIMTVCWWGGLLVCCSRSNVKRESDLNMCEKDRLLNCSVCRCPYREHKIVNCVPQRKFGSYQADQQKKFRHTLITTIVTIDLFYKENNVSAGQLYDGLIERIKQESRYSILETMYEYEMGGREKGITADECMKYIREGFVSLEEFVKIDDDFKYKTLMAGGDLRVKC